MKNTVRFFALVLGIFFLVPNSLAFGQEEEGHFFVVTTWKTVMPEGGSAAERDSLLLEWTNAVLKANDKILSSKDLRHYYGGDSHDWIIIEEYKNWADIEEAGKINTELNKKKWPNEKKRKEFFKELMKYFSGHSDEIYRELPKFGK